MGWAISRVSFSQDGEETVVSDSLGGFFKSIFRADFMPHGHCYFWKPEIVWLQVISNGAIAIAYFSIPLMLIHFIRKRKDVPFHWIFLMFASFILWCGVTHILDIVVIWVPAYRLDSIVRAITAVVSVMTAFFLFPLIPQALALRSPKELEDKNLELETAYARIKESEKLKDEFFAKVSHELRTPLTLILSPLEAMLSGENGPVPSAYEQPLRIMHNNAIRLLQIVNGILDFSKFKAGKVDVNREATNITELTKSVLNDFQPYLAQRNLRSEFVSNATEPILIDRYLYERILFNLLSNAIKFNSEGGQVRVTVATAEGKIRLMVSDTGMGIAEKDLPYLFELFRQVDGAFTRQFDGTGLGLALVKEFAGLLGGTATVSSKIGEGLTFTVECIAPLAEKGEGRAVGQRKPLALVPKYDIKSTPSEDAKESAAYKILVAEDNLELATHTEALLRQFGQIKVAGDGEEALKIARSWIPDLVLSDVMMPKMGGLDLCRELKKHPATAAIPVVLLTALTHREALLRGWQAGASEYLFKPFHPTELKTRIRSMLTIVEQRKKSEEDRVRKEELEQFAYFATHDLREPLRTLITMSQLLEEKYGSDLNDQAKEFLAYIVEASVRMEQIIKDLVSYSALGSDTTEQVYAKVEEPLGQAVRQLHAAISESGAQISWDALPELYTSPSQLMQLFQNLLSNAIKFRGNAPLKIHIWAESSGDDCIFYVQDNGIGFEPEHAEQIFVIFRRLHGRQKYAGSGIGLAICKRIVERLGGRIWAESEPGKGARFCFSLPLKPV